MDLDEILKGLHAILICDSRGLDLMTQKVPSSLLFL